MSSIMVTDPNTTLVMRPHTLRRHPLTLSVLAIAALSMPHAADAVFPGAGTLCERVFDDESACEPIARFDPLHDEFFLRDVADDEWWKAFDVFELFHDDDDDHDHHSPPPSPSPPS